MRFRCYTDTLIGLSLSILAFQQLFAANMVVGENPPGHYQPVVEVSPINLEVSENPVAAETSLLSFSAAVHGDQVIGSITPELRPIIEKPIVRPKPLPFPVAPIHPVSIRPTYITSCQDINMPGTYILSQNINSSTSNCLAITSSGVTLDCEGHSVSFAQGGVGIGVNDVQDVSISGCVSHDPVEDEGEGLVVWNSTHVVVSNSDFENVDVFNSSRTYVYGNNILGTYWQDNGNSTLFENNSMQDYTDRTSNGCIESDAGSGNQYIDNQINGGWNGPSSGEQGGNSGILLRYEQNDTISSNTIQNDEYAGVQSVGALSNTLIENNQFANNQYVGIASLVNTDWENNTISGNQIQNSAIAIEVEFTAMATEGPVPSKIYFENNMIEDNTFSNPTRLSGGYSDSMVFSIANTGATTPPLSVVADNNTLKNNVLPTFTPGPFLIPSSGFIDGGGNVCGTLPDGSPIICHPS